MNLGLGDQMRGGSLLDSILQFAIPAYSVMRNAQAMFDPNAREGTLIGLFGDSQPQGEGLLGNGFVSTTPDVGGYGYDTYNYGNGDVGVENGGWGSSPSADSMASSEIGSYASYDDPNEF
jgi:hypothetical protein